MFLFHVEFSKTQVRCVHVILRRRRYGSGEWPGGGAAGGAVGRGGTASGLGPVDRARDGCPEGPGPGLVDVVVVVVVVVVGPAPLEEEEGASPPALLPGPVGLAT